MANDAIYRALLRDVSAPSSYVGSGVLTADDIYRAIETVRADTTYHICVGGDRHVVSPNEWERGGLARCANCFAVVDLGERE
jgi:hypothetical protein